MESVDFSSLHKLIGFEIGNEKLLLEAFTHRSAVNEFSQLKVHNERLEFLGDAVLELIATEFLFETFDSPEGELTSLRSALVKGEHLATIARKLHLGSYLLLSKGEERSGGREKDYLLANLLEAFIGAIYLDRGLEKTQQFIHEWILADLDSIIQSRQHIDAKSEFQELTQGELGVTPHYELISESGLDHEKSFVLAAYLGDQKVGEGSGNSKKQAQINAAADALSHREEWLKRK